MRLIDLKCRNQANIELNKRLTNECGLDTSKYDKKASLRNTEEESERSRELHTIGEVEVGIDREFKTEATAELLMMDTTHSALDLLNALDALNTGGYQRGCTHLNKVKRPRYRINRRLSCKTTWYFLALRAGET